MGRIFFTLLKLSIIFTPLFNTARAEENNYNKSNVYNYLLKPLLEVEELLPNSDTLRITHCQVVDPNLNQEMDSQTQQENTYEDLGACLYQAIPFRKGKKNNGKKSIYIHMLINKIEEITLILSWDIMSLGDIWSSYWNETLTPLNNAFILTAMNPYTISDVLNKITGIEDTELHIDEIQIKIQPHDTQEEQVSSITLIALDQSEVVYSMQVITNYYIGSDDFFINSIDKYKMDNENEMP